MGPHFGPQRDRRIERVRAAQSGLNLSSRLLSFSLGGQVLGGAGEDQQGVSLASFVQT